MNVILATRNPSKALQIQAIFGDSSINVISMDMAGIKGEAVEDGETLEENALKKAKFAYGQVANAWTMADDSGIFIDALGGVPGVHSAYWAGVGIPTEQFTQFIIQQMKGIGNRSATFRTVVCLISPEGRERFFVGEVRGHLLESPRVPPQPKMPYSPLFVPDSETMTWAEMSTEYENQISHRGHAFRQVREFLEGINK